MNHIYAVIMAGGAGERFWPKSRRDRPKQLLPIISGRSMLRETIDRLKGIVPGRRIYVVTNKRLKAAVRKEAGDVNIIAEPVSKNTAPCASYSARIIQKRDSDAVIAVLPADHYIKNINRFKKDILAGADAAQGYSALVTIGIKPLGAHTGYGYIKKGRPLKNGFYRVKAFTEKPSLPLAKRYVSSGKYLWNSGMFIWRADVFLGEVERYMPRLYNLVMRCGIDTVYKKAEAVSIDYGIMEKTDRAVVIGAGFGWDDVGNWASIGRHIKADICGNVKKGKVTAIDVKDSIIMTGGPLTAVMGVRDMVVIVEKDAVLVCPRDRAEEVKNIVNAVKRRRDCEECL